MQSSHYQKTAMRRKEIDAKRDRLQDKFIQDDKEMLPTFRKTTRDYHVEKMLNTLQHGAPIGRYSPSYERVWNKAPIIEIAGVKDRFGYNNKNSPLYVKPAEGQSSAMGVIDSAMKRQRRSVIENTNSAAELTVSPDARSRANKTTIQFQSKGMTGSDSIQQINTDKGFATATKGISSPVSKKSTKMKLKKNSVEKEATTGTITPDIATKKQSNTTQNSPELRQNTMTTHPSISENPSHRRLTKDASFGAGMSRTNSGKFLPNLSDLKYHSSFFISQNQNREVKAFDFMGYAKRKEIYDGLPKPVDSRFESPKAVCPLVSTKHKQ